jgi:WD repeat-containing protein 76
MPQLTLNCFHFFASLHPNGYALLSGGLDNTIALWDVRTMGNSLLKQKKSPQPIATYDCGRSINSVYFSPSGTYAVSTTMANKIDIFDNVHLHLGNNTKVSKKVDIVNQMKPRTSIRHDNLTGRWLTTFQAIFHPQLDLFVVGSMRHPRCIELFNPSTSGKISSGNELIRTVQGDGVTSVLSRLAFHPRTDQLIVCGGSSSGRVTIARKKEQ